MANLTNFKLLKVNNDSSPDNQKTTPEFWDCECKDNYIHHKSEQTCALCMTEAEEQPDSHVLEVVNHLMSRPIPVGTHCYFVMETQFKNSEYQALVAIEGETGYHLTEWTWGKDYKLAEDTAAAKNFDMGIDKITASRIFLHSMRKVSKR
jgi:hypothetical protein